MNKLGEFIRKYRLSQDLSLRQFAEKSGISHAHIDYLEKGSSARTGKPMRVTTEMIEKLAKATNTDISYLVNLSLNKDGDEEQRPIQKNKYDPKSPIAIAVKALENLSEAEVQAAIAFMNLFKKDKK